MKCNIPVSDSMRQSEGCVWQKTCTTNFSFPKQILISPGPFTCSRSCENFEHTKLHATKVNSISIQINKEQAVFTIVLIPIGLHNTRVSVQSCRYFIFRFIHMFVLRVWCFGGHMRVRALSGTRHKGFRFQSPLQQISWCQAENRCLLSVSYFEWKRQTNFSLLCMNLHTHTHNKVKRALWYVTGKNVFPLALSVFIYVSERQ